MTARGPERGTSDAARLDLAEFDYELPEDRIAQQALPVRDASRLLVLDRAEVQRPIRHARVRDLPALLAPGDLVVVNATRVLPARLVGERTTGGVAEALLLGPEGGDTSGRFRALVRISGHLRPGIKFRFRGMPEAGPAEAEVDATVAAETRAVDAEIAELGENGEVVLAFEPGVSPYAVGRAPLPPYINRARARSHGVVTRGEDRTPRAGGALDREHLLREAAEDVRTDLERYQTVFARVPGAVAAPTAGLHLTHGLLDALTAAGVRRAEVILHVSSGSFRPLCERDLRNGQLHAEAFELPEATADAIGETRRRGGRVVAVGTTTTRVLETQASAEGHVRTGAGETRLFLRPGDGFRVVDALLTNFHLPRSSLLLLVAAFAGRERVLAAYREALATDYRFYSYGDAMLIL